MLGMVLIVFVYFLSLRLFVWYMPILLRYVGTIRPGKKYIISFSGPPASGFGYWAFFKNQVGVVNLIIARISCLLFNAARSLWLAVFEHQPCQSLAVT